jgi:KDO2-lipid IV(A) lauroyltransferase
MSYWIARKIGEIVYLLVGKDRQERIKVIERIFKGKITHRQAQRVIRASFENFNKDLVDFFRIPKLNKEYLDACVEITGQENLDAVLEEGRGALLAGLHMGNGGFAASLLALKGYPVNIVVWEDANKRVDKLFQTIRQSKGVRIIYSHHAAKGVLEALKRNEVVAVTVDLSGGERDTRLNCWGREIRILRGPFVFAQKQDVPILPGVIIRQGNDSHKVIIGKPAKINMKQNRERGFEEDAARLFNFFKGYIEEYPEQWFWLRYLWQDLERN